MMGGNGVLRNWKLPFGIMNLGCFFVYGVQTLPRANSLSHIPHSAFFTLARKWHWMAITDFFLSLLFFSCVFVYWVFLGYEK